MSSHISFGSIIDSSREREKLKYILFLTQDGEGLSKYSLNSGVLGSRYDTSTKLKKFLARMYL